jgi:hypothetical protein
MSTRIRVGIGHDCSLLVLLETYGLPPFHTSGRVENMITVGHRRERPMAGQGDGIMEANTQQADCLAKGMGRLAAERV